MTTRPALLRTLRVPLVLAALGGLLAGPGTWSLLGGSEAHGVRASEWTRAQVVEQVAASPGVPVTLPVRLPDGYTWEGPDSSSSGVDGSVDARSSIFVAWGRPDDEPLVHVCTHTDAGRSCPGGDLAVERRIDGLGVTIALSGGRDLERHARFWRTVELTDALADVPWLG